MNKAYIDKDDVLCSFFFQQDVLKKWIAMNKYQLEICMKLKGDGLPESDINITWMTWDGLP